MLPRMICLLVSFLCVTATAFCGEANDVILDDGSSIRAEVVSLQDGVYTMRSESIGTFTLNASRVRRIERAASNPQQENFQARVNSTQRAIAQDPEAARMASAMAADPAFQELLNDPEAVAAIKANDTAALMRNPRFRALMADPKIQAMVMGIMGKTGDSQANTE